MSYAAIDCSWVDVVALMSAQTQASISRKAGWLIVVCAGSCLAATIMSTAGPCRNNHATQMLTGGRLILLPGQMTCPDGDDVRDVHLWISGIPFGSHKYC